MKLDDRYIRDIKATWKSHVKALKNVSSERELNSATRDVATFFSRLREDLLINKGLWYILGPWSGNKGVQVRDKVTNLLSELEDPLYMLTTSVDAGMPFEFMKDGVSRLISEADTTMSRKLIPALRKAIDLGLESFPPSELSLGGAKIIFLDFAGQNPYQVMHQYGKVYSPAHRDDLIDGLQEARKTLERKGMGHVWKGVTIFFEDLGGKGEGKYSVGSDSVTLDLGIGPSTLPYVLIHELGHRHWYKFMSRRDRQAFSAYFHTGEVDPVSEYGGTMAEEDFAETFAYYVTGKGLTRDQKERFKAFFGQRVSSLKEELIRLGSSTPELQPHLRHILDSLRHSERMATLDDLSQLSQDFGGYEEIPSDD